MIGLDLTYDSSRLGYGKDGLPFRNASTQVELEDNDGILFEKESFRALLEDQMALNSELKIENQKIKEFQKAEVKKMQKVTEKF